MHLRCQKGIELLLWGEFEPYPIGSYFHRKDFDVEVFAREAFSGLEGECFFVHRTSHLGRFCSGADDSSRENECVFVGAHVLAGVPLSTTFKIVNGNLYVPVFDRRATVAWKVGHQADLDPPRPQVAVSVCLLFPIGLLTIAASRRGAHAVVALPV